MFLRYGPTLLKRLQHRFFLWNLHKNTFFTAHLPWLLLKLVFFRPSKTILDVLNFFVHLFQLLFAFWENSKAADILSTLCYNGTSDYSKAVAYRCQRRIQNPVEHPWWSFFYKNSWRLKAVSNLSLKKVINQKLV